MAKKPTKVGTKKANKNNVLACGILNFTTALFIYLYVKVIITKNKTGNNKNI